MILYIKFILMFLQVCLNLLANNEVTTARLRIHLSKSVYVIMYIHIFTTSMYICTYKKFPYQ